MTPCLSAATGIGGNFQNARYPALNDYDQSSSHPLVSKKGKLVKVYVSDKSNQEFETFGGMT